MQSYTTQIRAQLPPQHLPAGHEQATEAHPAEAVRQFGRLAQQSPLTGHGGQRLHDRWKQRGEPDIEKINHLFYNC